MRYTNQGDRWLDENGNTYLSIIMISANVRGGVIYREDVPASRYKRQEVYIDEHNLIHREDGPALIFSSGHESYYWRGNPIEID